MEICIKTVFSIALASDVSEQATAAHSGIGPLVQRLSFKWAELEPWPICDRDRSGKPICYGDDKDYSCCREANRLREERQ